MKLTKEPHDLKNIGNLSVDELEYLQNALTCRAGHLLNLKKDLDADQRSDQIAGAAAYRAAVNSLLASGIASLTINPQTPLLATIVYPASATDALSKDWQNVGNDLWKSYSAIKHEHK
jgi:hypothetical protein